MVKSAGQSARHIVALMPEQIQTESPEKIPMSCPKPGNGLTCRMKVYLFFHTTLSAPAGTISGSCDRFCADTSRTCCRCTTGNKGSRDRGVFWVIQSQSGLPIPIEIPAEVAATGTLLPAPSRTLRTVTRSSPGVRGFAMKDISSAAKPCLVITS